MSNLVWTNIIGSVVGLHACGLQANDRTDNICPTENAVNWGGG